MPLRRAPTPSFGVDRGVGINPIDLGRMTRAERNAIFLANHTPPPAVEPECRQRRPLRLCGVARWQLLRGVGVAPGELPLWLTLPQRLQWLRDGLEHGFFAKHVCRWCRAPLNMALRAATFEEWHGHEWSHETDQAGVPYPAFKTQCPPAGWKNQLGALPPHGSFCQTRGFAAEYTPTDVDREWDGKIRRLYALKRAGKIDTVFRWTASGDCSYRTELVEAADFTLGNQ